MARTAPVPNIPAIPGMNPGLFVLGGGGDGGGSGAGGGGAGGGKQGAGGKNGGKDAKGGGKTAPDPKKYPKCGTASHPVDVVTGRAFTHPLVDFELPGPLPLTFARVYSSHAREVDVGLGWGWACSLGMRLEMRRRSVSVWTDQGTRVDFDLPEPGRRVTGPFGWVLAREGEDRFVVDPDDGRFYQLDRLDPDQTELVLTAVFDRHRNTIALRYERGRLAEIQDSAGRVLRVRSTPDGRIASIAAQNAVAQGQWMDLVTYAYDDAGHLTVARDADGYEAWYRYDEDHRLLSDRDRAGLTFHFRYDAEGRCVESWGDYGDRPDPSLLSDLPEHLADGVTKAKGVHHCLFTYAEDGYTEVTDSTQVRRYFGNDRGTLDREMDGGGVYSYTYDERGHILVIEDPLGAITTFERDERGRATRVVDPLGRATTYERDERGQVVRIEDPAGFETRLSRDEAGNVVQVVDAAGSVTSYQHDRRGQLVAIRSPDGTESRVAYDEQGNIASFRRADGSEWRYAHDALGRRTATIDPSGAGTYFTYSNRGDLLSERDPAGQVTRYDYDGEGRPVRITDPAGRANEIFWGGYGRICGRRDPAGRVMRLLYDREGELQVVRNERGEEHRYIHDPSGKLIGERTFDGRERSVVRDPRGRVVRVQEADGGVTLQEYNAAGELTSRELPDGTVERYEYDDRGLLAAVESGAVRVVFEHDALGRLVSEEQIVNGVSHRVKVGYDLLGRRTGRTTSLGHVEEVVRDALGRRTATLLDGERIGHEADPLSRETSRRLARGGLVESAFDPAGRLVGRRAERSEGARAGAAGEPAWLGGSSRSVTVDLSYAYDVAGELERIGDAQRGTTQLEYDVVGQLLRAVTPDGASEVFRYDEAGNLHEPHGALRTYGPGGRLLAAGDTTFEWDGAGRLVARRARDGAGERVTRYTWNGAGLLSQVALPDGRSVAMTYDALGRRVEKRVLDAQGALVASTRFVWDGYSLAHEIKTLAAEGGDPVVEERTYVFEEDTFVPLAHKHGGRWFHYVNAPNGAPERIVDGRGDVACELRRSAWGRQERAPHGQTDTPLGFQGQYEDEETGLFYNLNRYYDPEHGRYVSPDPLGPSGGMGPFRYGQNPVGWVDPLGLENIVYRVIRPDEDPSAGLTAKNPDAKYTVEGHVLHGSKKNFKSQFISTTRDPDVAKSWAEKSGNRIVKIDLDKVDGKVTDLSTPEGRDCNLKGKTSKNWAKKSAEVLVEGKIPPQAITPL